VYLNLAREDALTWWVVRTVYCNISVLFCDTVSMLTKSLPCHHAFLSSNFDLRSILYCIHSRISGYLRYP
jgi:hypothetical protein